MSAVRSADGTSIAFDRTGSGPPLIIVDGALCWRESGPATKLAAELADRFTVIAYDRRGRGESGDAATYAVAREVEDLAALIGAAGGRANVCGISSGGVLAMEAARAGAAIERLAVHEPPFVVDDSRPPAPSTYVAELNEHLAAGRRGAAVKRFMRLVGMPAVLRAAMPLFPGWRKLKGVAHTLPYDAACMGDTQSGKPLDPAHWGAVGVPTLVLVGGKSPAWMAHGTQNLADVLPSARRQVLEGQTHMVKPKVLAPALKRFFAGEQDSAERRAAAG
jgi:pimeloyl-ACP methyl ester carboxylesterase